MLTKICIKSDNKKVTLELTWIILVLRVGSLRINKTKFGHRSDRFLGNRWHYTLSLLINRTGTSKYFHTAQNLQQYCCNVAVVLLQLLCYRSDHALTHACIRVIVRLFVGRDMQTILETCINDKSEFKVKWRTLFRYARNFKLQLICHHYNIYFPNYTA